MFFYFFILLIYILSIYFCFILYSFLFYIFFILFLYIILSCILNFIFMDRDVFFLWFFFFSHFWTNCSSSTSQSLPKGLQAGCAMGLHLWPIAVALLCRGDAAGSCREQLAGAGSDGAGSITFGKGQLVHVAAPGAKATSQERSFWRLPRRLILPWAILLFYYITWSPVLDLLTYEKSAIFAPFSYIHGKRSLTLSNRWVSETRAMREMLMVQWCARCWCSITAWCSRSK